MGIEAEIGEIKKYLAEISKKLDELLYEKEVASLMRLTEISLSEFLKNEPDIYRIEDLKVRYK